MPRLGRVRISQHEQHYAESLMHHCSCEVATRRDGKALEREAEENRTLLGIQQKKKGKWEKCWRGRRRKIGNCQESSRRNREMGKVFERETKEDRELLGIQQNVGKWEKKEGRYREIGRKW